MTEKRTAGGDEIRYAVIKVRLYPTAEQAALMEKTFGCCRYLWNQMLADAGEFYAATDLHFIPTPARYKKDAPFLAQVDSQALCAVHQSLRRAFLEFFRAPADFRRPKFKRRKSGKDAYTTPCRQLPSGPTVYLTEEGVRLPKLGIVRANLHRKPLAGWSLRFVTVSRTRSGKHFAALTFGYAARTPERPAPGAENTLGLLDSPDRFYVDSGGRSPELPRRLAQSREKLARMQRKLGRMERGSRNYEEQLQKLRLLHEHIANQRRDFIHKESRRIANDWEAVCVRDAGLTEPAGFGKFRECLRYKLEQQGKKFVAVEGRAGSAEELRDMGLALMRETGAA